MKLYDCFVVLFLQAVNGILGAGSYGIAMAKLPLYLKHLCSYIETAGNKCPTQKSAAGLCRLVYAL